MNDFKLKVQKWKIRINRIGGFDGEQVAGDISDLYPHQAKMAEIIPPPNILSLNFDKKFHNQKEYEEDKDMLELKSRECSKWPCSN